MIEYSLFEKARYLLMSTENSEDNSNKHEEMSESFFEETEEVSNINDDIEVKKKFVKSKKLVGILTMIFLFVIVGTVVLAYPHFNEKKIEKTADSTIGEEKLSVSKTDKKAPTVKPRLNWDDYLGYWDIGGSETRELALLEAKDESVKFSLWYLRLNSADDILATLDGNIAHFSNQDGERILKGTLTFQETSIIVNITESSYAYMPVETMTFDNRHNESWSGAGYTDNESVDTLCNNCGVKLYSEEEKGWGYCNSCAGGFICHSCFAKLSAQEREWGYCNSCVESFRCTVCHQIKVNDCIDGICYECAPKCLGCGVAEWGGIVLEDGYCNSCKKTFTCYICNQFKPNDIFEGVCSDCAGPKCINCGSSQGGMGFIDGYCEHCYESLFGNSN